MLFWGLILLFSGVAGYLVCFPVLKNIKRRRLTSKPFPSEWVDILRQNVPVYEKMPQDLQEQLQRCIVIFVHEKVFIGAQELQITDEIRVTVAAQACLLLLNRETDIYASLVRIIMYPSAYKDTRMRQNEQGVMEEETIVRLGESWTGGDVVLSWEHSKSGAQNFFDAHNVVIHEFSHQLDQADGVADGIPLLGEQSCYRTWATLIDREYATLIRTSKKRRRRPVLRDYGATNEAEFFAVASEAFFEKPRQMRKQYPDLFAELQRFYLVDPSEWIT